MKIVDFHMHIGFERSTFENDICLLQLSQNVKANPNIAPVCLPQDRMSDDFSGNCYIAGWGVLAENTNTIPTILQEAEVPYVKHDRCQTIFQKVNEHSPLTQTRTQTWTQTRTWVCSECELG